MKSMIRLLAFIALGFGALFAKDYNVDIAHSQVAFKIKHLSVSNVNGDFAKFNGTLSVDNNTLTALSGEVDVDSINTNNETRDAHIKDMEYFNVAKFPKATLKLVKMEGNNGVFDLNIKGITKQVKLAVEVLGVSKNQSGKEVVGLSISGKINRKDFDIAKNTSSMALGDEITLTIDIEGVAK